MGGREDFQKHSIGTYLNRERTHRPLLIRSTSTQTPVVLSLFLLSRPVKLCGAAIIHIPAPTVHSQISPSSPKVISTPQPSSLPPKAPKISPTRKTFGSANNPHHNIIKRGGIFQPIKPIHKKKKTTKISKWIKARSTLARPIPPLASPFRVGSPSSCG